MSLEIIASEAHAHSFTGRVFAERTGKIYNFAFYKESGAVALSHGTRTVPENQMRDVRNFVSTQFAAPAVGAPVASEAELDARAKAAGWHYCAKSDAWTHDNFEDYAGDAEEACEMSGLSLSPAVEIPATYISADDVALSPEDARAIQLDRMIDDLPADAPVLYFQQDGAYFSYRDRPFYFVDSDYVGPDGRTAGVCPSFCTQAPFDVSDFDNAGAERAAEWFAQEAAKAGFRAERAPDFYRTTAPVPCHPDEELADLRTVRTVRTDGESGGFMTVAEFVAFRALPVEPVARETFDSFETWRPAYLAILEDCWFEAELRDKDLLEEEYYTAGLTPVEAANRFFKCL